MDERFSLHLSPPAPVRALNAVLAPFAHTPELSPEAMLRRARLETGLDDLGDPTAYGRLEALCREADSNPNLSPFGRIAVAIFYHFHIVDRLRIVDLLKRRPEIDDVPVKEPIFIVGWYRTGTTLLHNLLAADTRHRAPRTWELISAAPLHDDPAWDRRLRMMRTQFILQLSRYLVPESAAAHYVPIDGPEECFFLLENDFVSSTMFNTYGGYRYADWLLEQDLRPSYRFFRQQLKVLSYRHPEKRWVLKCPLHLWHLDALLDVFPDARIVFTHRDVAEALPSNCSLSAMTTSKFANRTSLEDIGEFWSRYYREGISRAMEARRRIPDDRCIDVPLPWISKRPVDALDAIYRHFDLGFGAETRGELLTALRNNPKQTKGEHHYTAAQFGLSR
ncbi:MAG: sulfotransferase, partial [Polyangiaceae bacterium]|nr:sulfotransferase [Polyangiaceae bacterium]